MVFKAGMHENAFSSYAESYDAVCSRGLRLAGETRDYFAHRRVAYVRQQFVDPSSVHTIVDFGCGLGDTAPHFWKYFPNAKVLGLDTADQLIQKAQQRYGGQRAEFLCADPPGRVGASLVYCNGVFHHIPVSTRKRTVKKIFEWLVVGGLFALWENNPWNPGTRLVMRRIQFDRDAEPLSYRAAEELVRTAGFEIVRTSFQFYFPSPLRALRPLEVFLQSLPLGAQYCVLAQKTAPCPPAAAQTA